MEGLRKGTYLRMPWRPAEGRRAAENANCGRVHGVERKAKKEEGRRKKEEGRRRVFLPPLYTLESIVY